ncbi:MAG: hypothetical protein U0T83_07005 [Bacteriovoracaceae bacterium]
MNPGGTLGLDLERGKMSKRVLLQVQLMAYGLTLAKLYSESGNQVIVCDVNQENLKKAKLEYPSVHFFECNVADKRWSTP